MLEEIYKKVMINQLARMQLKGKKSIIN